MASVTFDRFDGGLLLARPSSVSPANSLSRLVNMDVQPGGWLRARPKVKPVSSNFTLGPQWKGLETNAGYLWTFSAWEVATSGFTSGTVVRPETGDRIAYAFYSTGTGGSFSDASHARLLGVSKWGKGFLTVLSDDDGTTCYGVLFDIDTSTHVVTGTLVSDVNMPMTGLMVTAGSRVYAIGNDGQTVRFCAVGDPTDWTTAGDAGFLPVAQHFGSGQRAYAMGLYQDKLAIFTEKSVQLWTIDPDPTAMVIDRVIDGIGTRHHKAITSLNGDLLFLSETGVRSLTTPSSALFPTDMDVGLPVRALTDSPTSLTRFSNGGLEPSALALAASPFAQMWIAAPGRWTEEV